MARRRITAAGFGEDDITKRLMRLDRYERRALSRRKSAIAAFDALPGEPAPKRRRRHPMAAVAAAARLGRLSQDKPISGKPAIHESPPPPSLAQFGRTNPISAGHATGWSG